MKITNISDAPTIKKLDKAIVNTLRLMIDLCRYSMDVIAALTGMECPEMEAMNIRLDQLEEALEDAVNA